MRKPRKPLEKGGPYKRRIMVTIEPELVHHLESGRFALSHEVRIAVIMDWMLRNSEGYRAIRDAIGWMTYESVCELEEQMQNASLRLVRE